MKSLRTEKHIKESNETFIKKRGGQMPAALKSRYAVRITDTVKDAIDGDIDHDPVAKQYLPQNKELKILPEEDTDPTGDQPHTPVKGIVHRYEDRVLLKLANVCAVYCRYCFRREKVGPGSNVLNVQETTKALDYIAAHDEIFEVILSGGDPLVISPRRLRAVFDRLENIKHVHAIRIHTRVPVADLSRITPDMIAALTTAKPLTIVLHINHTQELTYDVRACLKALHKTGANLLSQSVLLKGVNDSSAALSDLFKNLLSLKIQPYYLHHPDLAPGTSHFRLSLEEGQTIMRRLRGTLPGHAIPHYMIDIPGGFGKVPVNESYVKKQSKGHYKITDPNGQVHDYKESF